MYASRAAGTGALTNQAFLVLSPVVDSPGLEIFRLWVLWEVLGRLVAGWECCSDAVGAQGVDERIVVQLVVLLQFCTSKPQVLVGARQNVLAQGLVRREHHPAAVVDGEAVVALRAAIAAGDLPGLAASHGRQVAPTGTRLELRFCVVELHGVLVACCVG